jgi:hypothetical protein
MTKSHFILVAYAFSVALVTAFKPDFLASNSFLLKFAGSELLSLLAVILAITFASVANIHLALNQIIGRAFAHKIEHGKRKAQPLRNDINGNAWLLFYAFLAYGASLFIGAIFADNMFVKSAVNGIALGTLLLNVLVFRDIYCTVFELAASDVAVKGAEPEYSPDTPQVGAE